MRTCNTFFFFISLRCCTCFPVLPIQISPAVAKRSIIDARRYSSLSDETTTRTTQTSSSSTFQCTQVTTAKPRNIASALSSLLQEWTPPKDAAVGFLFVSPPWAPHLQQIVQLAQSRVGTNTKLLTIVGGGVIGGGRELENTCSMSFLGGVLPDGSSVDLFSVDKEDPEIPTRTTTTTTNNKKISNIQNDHNDRPSSHILFADPHYTKIHEALEQLNGIVAGGISVAQPKEASLAIGSQVLPPGSLIGASFSGNVGLQVVVSQGCRPVGPTYRVTSIDGPVIHELDSERALDQLEETMQQACDQDQELVRNMGILGGIHREEVENLDHPDLKPEEFSLREVTGFRPRSGSILVCGPQIDEGDYFQFHVRSKDTALEDWQFVLQRVETERMFLGEEAGTTMGAIQISCLARGQGLFGKPNVDLHQIQQLVDGDDGKGTPIAGLLANAEIAPLGIHMGSTVSSTTSQPKSCLHGFAAVVVLLCDYTETHSPAPSTTCLGNSTTLGDVWG